jgi:catalase
VFKDENRKHLVENMAGSMKTCRPDIKDRMIKLCSRVHPDFGKALADGLGISVEKAKL